jgi:small subunit ribosomal protein S1
MDSSNNHDTTINQGSESPAGSDSAIDSSKTDREAVAEGMAPGESPEVENKGKGPEIEDKGKGHGGDHDQDHDQDLDLDLDEEHDDDGSYDEEGQENFRMDQLYEESFKSLTEGEVLTGTVVQITKEHIMLDVGSKSEGRIHIREFLDENGDLTVKKGDTVEALLVKRGDDDGDMILSKEKAARQKLWDEIARIHIEGGEIEGVVTGRVKGGLNVDINGIQAFLPGSQADIKQVKSTDPYIGKTFNFVIIKMNRRRSNVVLSRRALQQKEIESKRSNTLNSLKEGEVVEGVVKNLTSYGAFVDLGGLDGLLHVTDVTWGRIGRLEDHLKVGEKIKVKILAFDKERVKVSLGLKQLQEDPWSSVTKSLKVGDKVNGRVVSLTDYGAFVEISPGVEGLIHVSEMSWTRKVRNPAAVLKVDDIVECVIQNINHDGKRISLSMKQIEPNPWATVADRYPIGTIIEGKIKSITDFGVFIGIDEGIDGLVHISDISWTRRNRHPSELFKRGDSVRALILAIDTEQERFSLGIKQLEEDPWLTAVANYPVDKIVTGKVNSITEFGVFIELQEGIDGLIHTTQTNVPKGKALADYFRLGEELTAKILSISSSDHKIGLTLKLQSKEEERQPKELLERLPEPPKESLTFGSAFEDLDIKLQAKQNQSEEPPSESEESPSESQESPSKSEEPPSESQESPSEPQESPAESQESPSEPQESPAESGEPEKDNNGQEP